jgi:hypothetical protein
MGTRNRQIICESWSWEVLAARYARLFAALLDEDAATAAEGAVLVS